MTATDYIDRAGAASLRWLWLTAPLLIVDQLSKWLVTLRLVEFQRINILPIFDLVRFHNTGAAFSFLADAGGWQHWLFTGIAVLVSMGILYYQWTLPARGCRILAAGLALILAGAVGNLIDRLMFGYVVDFIFFYYEDWSWPAFNVADSAITIGVILVLYDGIFLERKRKVPADA
jgi:signal peptidase II